MDKKQIQNISAKTEESIKRKTAFSLPDRPGESGMRADEIKKAFYSSITDNDNSVLSEMKRVVSESNEVFEEINTEFKNVNNELNKKIGNERNITLDFAESERQKSKNLWSDGLIEGKQFVIHKLSKPIPANTTFTISFITTSSDTDDNKSLILFFGNGVELGGSIVDRGVRASATKTFDKDITDIYFYASIGIGLGENDTFRFREITITTDGSTAYQPYNGEIVHEKQLLNKELVFGSLYKYIDIDTSTLTTLSEYYDLFKFNSSVIYYASLGAKKPDASENNTEFKKLIGSPFGSNNYVNCYIKQYCNGNENGRYGIFELLALNSFYDGDSNYMAKGYIYRNGNRKTYFSGWQIVGG